jgi:hypothetical protein
MATPVFKARSFKMEIDDYDEALEFRKGLILAKQNNSCALFPQLIDVMNSIMAPHERALMEAQVRGEGPDKVTIE